MKNSKVDQFIKNPKKSLWKLALPVGIGMLVQVSYNLVDTAYVGRLGPEAIAALTFAFPVFFFLMSINSGVAAGMSSQISRFLGAKKKKDAENAALHGFILSLILALIMLIIGFIIMRPMFILFGAEGIILTYSIEYMSIILLGVFFMFMTFNFSQFLSSQGDTKTPMKIHVGALLLNIILDPIFIFGFGLGIKGAAIATLISFFFGLLLSIYYVKKTSYLNLRPKRFRFSKKILKETFAIGAPASFTMLVISIFVIFINRIMVYFSTDHVAAFGIATRLESVAILPIVAISLALMPIAGMFYGAKKFHLMKQITSYAIRNSIFITSGVGVVFFIISPLLIRIFTPDLNLIKIGADYLRIDTLTFPLMAITMIISRVLQAMGFGLPGFIISIVRVLVIAVPFAYISVLVFNLSFLSVAFSMVFGGMVASAVGIYLLNKRFNACP